MTLQEYLSSRAESVCLLVSCEHFRLLLAGEVWTKIEFRETLHLPLTVTLMHTLYFSKHEQKGF